MISLTGGRVSGAGDDSSLRGTRADGLGPGYSSETKVTPRFRTFRVLCG